MSYKDLKQPLASEATNAPKGDAPANSNPNASKPQQGAPDETNGSGHGHADAGEKPQKV